MRILQTTALATLLVGLPVLTFAQDTGAAETSADAATETDELLTEAQLETLVAPVALYPDTLLIQILVAAASPLDVMKAGQFLEQNSDRPPEELKPEIEAEGWDASVEVLATAFPDVLTAMADHIDWTETTGDAMVAQTDDVMAAVQVLRDQAIQSGALISGDQQTVETDQDDNVVITPTDPDVVYAPQYQPAEVWTDDPGIQSQYTGSDSFWGDVGDAVVTGVIVWGTFSLIDEIFDDDDDWDDYWGCRNCGGWGGGPIIRDPDIDIDVDGNVNIGNRVDIDRDTIGDRLDGDHSGWKPDDGRRDEAREKLAEKRGSGGATTLPASRLPQQSPGRGDDLRAKLSGATGAEDISRGGGGAAAAAVGAAAGAGTIAAINRPSKVPSGAKRDAIANTGKAKPDLKNAVQARPAAQAKPAIKKPAAQARPAVAKPTVKKPVAMQKKAPARKVSAAKARGGKSRPNHKLKKR